MPTASAASTTIHGRYRVRAVAGRGSSGLVLEVHDLEADEPRALKVVASGPDEAMLLHEFEQLARLRHPSLPRVFEVGRTREPIEDLAAGAPFFVAEWIAGERCDARPWTGDLGAAIWALLADVAGALATIHAAGLVHADVAPQNVLVIGAGGGAGAAIGAGELDRGGRAIGAGDPDRGGSSIARAVLVDLGLAGGIEPGARGARGARGTPAYMAPEALAGLVEPRGDLYGLGAIAVRLATGRPPFEAATLGELVQRIAAGAAPRALPGVPRPLADLIQRLCARDLEARPGSALAVLDELDQLAPAIAPGSARRARPRVGPPPAPGTWPGAEPWIAALDVDLAAGAAIAVIGPAASGGRALVDTALRRRQLEQVARPSGGAAGAAAGGFGTSGGAAGAAAGGAIIAGTLDEVATRLGVSGASGASARAWLERVTRAARRAGGPVVLELAGDPRAADLVAALGRAPHGEHAAIALVEQAPEPGRSGGWPGVALHRAPLLDADGVAALAHAMLGGSPPRAWSAALHAASGGLPLAVIELLHSAANERDPLAVDWSARTSAGAAELHANALRAATAGARRIAAAIAVWGGRARIDRVLATSRSGGASAVVVSPGGASAVVVSPGGASAPVASPGGAEPPVGLAEVAELVRAGVARRRGAEVAIDRAAQGAVEQVTGADELAELAGRALALVAGDGTSSTTTSSTASSPDLDPATADLIAPLLERAPLDAARAPLACGAVE